MTPKEKRDKLFRKSRPKIRPLQIFDGNEYHRDMKILYIAYQKEPFYAQGPGLDQIEFAKKIEQLSQEREILIMEDESSAYPSGFGPIAFWTYKEDGWKYEPHAQYFHWATPRNKLRATVAAVQWLRYSRKVGVCVLYALKDSKSLMDHVAKYGVLQYVGMIIGGDKRGNEYLYSIRGKKK